MPDSTHVDGSCLCGAVTFRLHFPTRFFAHCHCESCRRAFGAAVVSWVGVKDAQFELLSGRDDLGRFASSPGTTRSFCRTCGTSLFFESARWPNEVHAAAATLRGPVDRPPGGHAFYEEHVAWLQVADPPR